jgi:hypothetical protein
MMAGVMMSVIALIVRLMSKPENRDNTPVAVINFALTLGFSVMGGLLIIN